MSQDSLLFQAFVFLAAAVIAVPIAARLGLGGVLGYLLAGVAIGPFGFGFIGNDAQDLLHFAEFGVVMMLFVIGLELQPALLWRLRNTLLGRVRVNIRALESDLQREFGAAAEPVRDEAWDSSTLRAEAGANARHDMSTS